jgi:hypothetical protein
MTVLQAGRQGQSVQPSEAQSMNAESLRVTLSKIAPLEQWNSEWSQFGPRVCWRFFRPSPQQLGELWRVISSFKGHTEWHLVDNCLVTGVGWTFLALPTTPSQITSETASLPSPSRRQLSQEQVSNDLLSLASQIEDRLHLKTEEPKPFSQDLLSKEGLRRSRGQFEDFEDGGQRIVYLIVDPGTLAVFEPTKTDVMLHFEPFDDEITAIFSDVLGVDLALGHGRALSDSEAEKIEKAFPIFWKVSDYYEDAYLSPREAALLLQECATLDKVAYSSKALRGLDKLFRIARWASEKRCGVLFSAP